MPLLFFLPPHCTRRHYSAVDCSFGFLHPFSLSAQRPSISYQIVSSCPTPFFPPKLLILRPHLDKFPRQLRCKRLRVVPKFSQRLDSYLPACIHRVRLSSTSHPPRQHSVWSRSHSIQQPCYPTADLSNSSRAFTIQPPCFTTAAVLSLSSRRAFQQPCFHYPATALSSSRRTFTIQQPCFPTAELSLSSRRAFRQPPCFHYPATALSNSRVITVQQPCFHD
jgi:hypothetical protein